MGEILSLTLTGLVDRFPDFEETDRREVDLPRGIHVEARASVEGAELLFNVMLTANGDYSILLFAVVVEPLATLHKPTLDAILASFQTFPPPESSAAHREGLWAGTPSDPAEPWLEVYLTPGLDADIDPWYLAFSGSEFRCSPKRQQTGWRLEGCEQSEEEGIIDNLSVFIPETGDSGLELQFTFETTTVRGVLARLEQRDEPQSSDNVSLLWHTRGTGSHSDIWAEGELVFAPRHYLGQIELLDSTSGNILGVASVPPTSEGDPDSVLDVKAHGATLYVSTRDQGVVVFDVSVPAEPKLIGQYRVFDGEGSAENFTNIHNIFLSPAGRLIPS